MKLQALTNANLVLALALFGTGVHAAVADKELLDILLKNGAINKAQYHSMTGKEGLASSELLDVLSKNGVITKDQYSKLAQKAPPALAVAPTPVATPAKLVEKDSATVKLSEKGLEFESNDGNFKAKIGGRVQADSQVNWNDPKGPAGTDLGDNVGFRRARIYTEGTLFKDYDYRFEYDFARNNGGTQGITDAFIKYTAFKPFAISIGQLSEGKSMESVISNNYMTFIERSLPNNAFIEAGPASKYQLGIIGETYAKAFDMAYTVRGGLTTESIGAPAPGNSSTNTQGLAAGNGNSANRNNGSGNISYQLVGRVTLAPYKDKAGNLLHVGAWGSWRDINNNYNTNGGLRSGGWRFVSQPGTGMDRTNWMDTANLTTGKNVANWREVNNIAMFGAELGGVLGPAHFSAEYMRADISGHGYDSGDVLEGFYAYAGYFLTGESRPYDEKKGTWGRLSPKQGFIGGSGWGAWEVAARYDNMDMNAAHINGGSVGTGTLALNWYLNSHIRLMTNWVHVFNVSTARAGACTPAAAGTNPTLGCFNGLNPDIWETAVRFDY